MADIGTIEIEVKAEKLGKLKDDLGETANEYAKMVATINAEAKRLERTLKASAEVQAEAMSRVTGNVAQRELEGWFAQQRRRLTLMKESERMAEREAAIAQKVAAEKAKEEAAVIAAHRRRLAMAAQREAMMEKQLQQEAQVTAAVQRSAMAQNQLGQRMSRTSQVIQQSGYQIGDFIVQVQSGTNAYVAAGQQLTQMAGLLLMFNNPLALSFGLLLSIVIPLATAYGAYSQRTQEASDKTVVFKNSLSDLQVATDNLNRSIKASKLGVEEDELDVVIKITKAKEAELLARARIGDIIRDQSGNLRTLTAEEQARVNVLLEQVRANAEIVKQQGDVLYYYRQAKAELARIRKEQEEQERKKEEHEEKVKNFSERGLAAINSLGSSLNTANGIAGTFAGTMETLAGWSMAAARAWGIVGNYSLEGAGDRYEASGSADAAARNNATTMGKGGGVLAGGAGGIRDFPKAGGKGGGGGGSNPIEQELETLRSYLMEADEIEKEEYQKRQDTLRAALDQRMLTLEEYNALEKELKIKHNEELAGIDALRYGNALTQAEFVFSELASAAQAGGQKYQKIYKAFAIGEALITGYKAAVSAWEKGMTAGGPGLAAAYTALSLAKTGGLIAGMRSGSSSSGGSSRGSVGRVQSNAAPSPQTVYVSGLDPNALFTGEMISNLFENFYQENDNRGKVFVVAR